MQNLELDLESLLALAIAIAYQAHDGQIDKAGKPYISHPLTVMAQMDTIESKIVAVLHDAIEDSDLTIADLATKRKPRALPVLAVSDGM